MKKRLHVNGIFFKMLYMTSIPICLSFLFYMLVNYKENLSKIELNRKWQSDFILKQIRDNLNLYDSGLAFYEESFNKHLIRVSQNIINQHKQKSLDLSKANLYEILQNSDPDSIIDDLYIIDRRYTIVNTTFKKDSGLNFAERDPDLKIFFDSIFSASHCIVDRFTVERSTNKTKKYCYQATSDKQYILEMGLTSKNSTTYKHLLDSVIFSIKNQFPEITSIHLLQASYNSNEPGLIKQFKPYYNRAISTKSNQHLKFLKNREIRNVAYLYLPIQSSQMFDAYIIQVISNDSIKKKLIRDELVQSFYFFCLTFFPLLGILIIVARSFTKPIMSLSEQTKGIDEHNLNKEITIRGAQELKELSSSFNNMLRRLRESYETLEDKVVERTTEIQRQKQIIEEKHLEITDSINYAQRIQQALLPQDSFIKSFIPDYFIVYQPKEAVSGDFYWADILANGNFAFACADSTGHGVPGAIMSILNITNLKKSVKEGLVEPADILNQTRVGVINDIANDGSEEGGNDGMDCVLLSFDFQKYKVSISMANNPVWIIRNNELIKFSPDKMPVGRHIHQNLPFNQYEFDLMKGDIIYLFSDGFSDQFGGPKQKKFKLKTLENLLIEISDKEIEVQKHELYRVFNHWKGENEQTDDVCVVGFKIT